MALRVRHSLLLRKLILNEKDSASAESRSRRIQEDVSSASLDGYFPFFRGSFGSETESIFRISELANSILFTPDLEAFLATVILL